MDKENKTGKEKGPERVTEKPKTQKPRFKVVESRLCAAARNVRPQPTRTTSSSSTSTTVLGSSKRPAPTRAPIVSKPVSKPPKPGSFSTSSSSSTTSNHRAARVAVGTSDADRQVEKEENSKSRDSHEMYRALQELDMAHKFRLARYRLLTDKRHALEKKELTIRWKEVEDVKDKVSERKKELWKMRARKLKLLHEAAFSKTDAVTDVSWMQYAFKEIADGLENCSHLLPIKCESERVLSVEEQTNKLVEAIQQLHLALTA